MSEPKTSAKIIEQVAPGLFHFQIKDDRINHISDGYAVVEGKNVTLIDPLPIDEATLLPLGDVRNVVLTSPSHQRSAWSYRRRTKAKVHAPEGIQGIDEKPDATYKAGDRLPGGLKAVPAPGPKAPHFALHLDKGARALFVGDLLMNEPGKGLIFLSDKYMQDPAAGTKSARQFLELDFEILCCGHGAPVTRDAKQTLKELLKTRGA